MLIDATHPEETRVAVVDGTRLEEFDFEIASRRQIKSNIYLAKVTRVEPSLQAAFVEYGGNRHGFLPFPEIHPDYYRIPVGDRPIYAETHYERPARGDRRPQEDRAEEHRPEEDQPEEHWAETAERVHSGTFEADQDAQPPAYGEQDESVAPAEAAKSEEAPDEAEPEDEGDAYDAPAQSMPAAAATGPVIYEPFTDDLDDDRETDGDAGADAADKAAAWEHMPDPADHHEPERHEQNQAEPDFQVTGSDTDHDAPESAGEGAEYERYESEPEPSDDGMAGESPADHDHSHDHSTNSGSDEAEHSFAAPTDRSMETPSSDGGGEEHVVDVVGGDEVEDAQRRRRSQMPRYKIQEVIKRRQIMLVQVSKEERGNKGAAVTTFLSLPGRYCVLMPNTSRGGGVSRKIANPADRKRMKELISDLEVPEGMSVILRTAGVERSKAEIKRDLEYLLRLWENIRTLTLQSTAPALIYEEGNLVKRAIRDLYTRDIDEIEIAGEEGYRQAKDFMRMLMPSHAKRVQPYRDPSIPLFFRYQVESQIDLIHNPVMHLRSGGYIVINQTEALVSIDVNSGRSTRERNIEETALKTNCEAADEIARQLRLRDMGGLIVIDFIDMDEPRHDAQVERRLKEAMKNDRARIQVGRISPFGLLELSRQRLHPSLIETNFHTCAHCLGTGLVRSIESAALLVLRAIEEEGIKRRSAELGVTVASDIALYILNAKRSKLIDIEQRYGFSVRVMADDSLIAPEHRIERLKLRVAGTEPPSLNLTEIMAQDRAPEIEEDDEEETEETQDSGEASAEPSAKNAEEAERKRKRRRGRRRRGRDGAPGEAGAEEAGAESPEGEDASADGGEDGEAIAASEAEPAAENAVTESDSAPGDSAEAQGDDAGRRRRRGRRGGRGRTRRGEDGELVEAESPEAESPETENAGAETAGTESAGIDEEHHESAAIAETGPEPEQATEPVDPRPAEPDLAAPDTVRPESAASAPEHAPEPETEPALAAGAPEAELALTPPQSVETAEPTAPEPETPAAPAPPARDYEIVNQPPPEPKRGFWKRLVR
jgi:ribonuclease E